MDLPFVIMELRTACGHSMGNITDTPKTDEWQTHNDLFCMVIQIGWASKYKQNFKRKMGGDDRARGTQGQFDARAISIGLEWEWIRDYLAGCLGSSDEANRKKE